VRLKKWSKIAVVFLMTMSWVWGSESQKTVHVKVEYVGLENSLIKSTDVDGLMTRVFKGVNLIRDSIAPITLKVKFSKPAFEKVSKVVDSLYRLELNGSVELSKGSKILQSVKLTGKSIEEGRRKCVESALKSIRWQDDSLKELIKRAGESKKKSAL